MVRVFSETAGPQNPMFGISYANIVPRLHKRNWKTKATCRVHEDGPLYVWISRGRSGREPKGIVFRVTASVVGAKTTYSQFFRTLEAALAYANGEDDGDLGRESRPAGGRHEYPEEVGNRFVISFPFVRRAAPDDDEAR